MWCWNGTRNTCQLFFYGDARVITWVKSSMEKSDNELKRNVSNKNMHEFSFFPTNHRVSAITNVRYESVCYIEVFLGEFDCDLARSLKKCLLLPCLL